MKAVTLTHNDFDGLGSLLMLMIKFKPEGYFFTNYYDFDKAVKQVIEYKHEHDVDHGEKDRQDRRQVEQIRRADDQRGDERDLYQQ